MARLRLGQDEAAFSARELSVVARRGLSWQMDVGLRVASEHQESTWGGGGGVAAVLGGS